MNTDQQSAGQTGPSVESIARILCKHRGYDPDAPEPGGLPICDGYSGKPGDSYREPWHFAWRNFTLLAEEIAAHVAAATKEKDVRIAELEAELSGEREHVRGYVDKLDHARWKEFHEKGSTPGGWRCLVYNAIAEKAAALQAARAQALTFREELIVCFKHLGREIARMTLTESAQTGTQVLSRDLAELLDKTADEYAGKCVVDQGDMERFKSTIVELEGHHQRDEEMIVLRTDEIRALRTELALARKEVDCAIEGARRLDEATRAACRVEVEGQQRAMWEANDRYKKCQGENTRLRTVATGLRDALVQTEVVLVMTPARAKDDNWMGLFNAEYVKPRIAANMKAIVDAEEVL